MSHIGRAMPVPVASLTVAQEMCDAKGWTLHRGQQTYKWYGRWVGDTPMPKGMTHKDLGKCDHAISIPGCSYEIGLRQNPDGTFDPVWDYWGAGGLVTALGGQDAPVLQQSYMAALLKHEARAVGGAVESEIVEQDGTIRLRLLAAR